MSFFNKDTGDICLEIDCMDIDSLANNIKEIHGIYEEDSISLLRHEEFIKDMNMLIRSAQNMEKTQCNGFSTNVDLLVETEERIKKNVVDQYTLLLIHPFVFTNPPMFYSDNFTVIKKTTKKIGSKKDIDLLLEFMEETEENFENQETISEIVEFNIELWTKEEQSENFELRLNESIYYQYKPCFLEWSFKISQTFDVCDCVYYLAHRLTTSFAKKTRDMMSVPVLSLIFLSSLHIASKAYHINDRKWISMISKKLISKKFLLEMTPSRARKEILRVLDNDVHKYTSFDFLLLFLEEFKVYMNGSASFVYMELLSKEIFHLFFRHAHTTGKNNGILAAAVISFFMQTAPIKPTTCPYFQKFVDKNEFEIKVVVDYMKTKIKINYPLTFRDNLFCHELIELDEQEKEALEKINQIEEGEYIERILSLDEEALFCGELIV